VPADMPRRSVPCARHPHSSPPWHREPRRRWTPCPILPGDPPDPLRPLPDNLPYFAPPLSLSLTPDEVAEALRTAKRRAAPGLSGLTSDHLKVFLDHPEAFPLLASALSQLANAEPAEPVLRALAQSRLTALSKPGGGVRGISTGGTPCAVSPGALSHASTQTASTPQPGPISSPSKRAPAWMPWPIPVGRPWIGFGWSGPKNIQGH
jgi:hypothetical protein